MRHHLRGPAAVAVAVTLGLLAACSGSRSEQTNTASGPSSTTATAPLDGETSTTLAAPGPSTTAKAGVPTSSTIAYFTLPPSTTAPPPDGGGYQPGESVGRRFVEAALDGKRADAVPIATKKAIEQLEPWKPYSRQNDQDVEVPSYRYAGSPKKGSFDATLAPTIFLHCEVDTGKVTTCSFGE